MVPDREAPLQSQVSPVRLDVKAFIDERPISAYQWLLVAMCFGLFMAGLFFALRGTAAAGVAERPQSLGAALGEAFGHRGYLYLTAGFFVCGFQVTFIMTHLPAYIVDRAMPGWLGGASLALIGFFNIIGSLAAGVIAQRYSKPYLLAYIYIARSVAVTAFLLLPQSPLSVIIFAAVMGILWLSTVPPTNALVAIMFGTRHLGMLGGVVFLSHQIGSFLGVWLGGFLYDRLGSYDLVWWLGVGMGIFAAIVHWPIQERPAPRPAMA